MSHRYAAILAADVAHYSALMEGDGEGTVRALKHCKLVFQRCISEHGGREFGSVGDSFMAEFSSPVEALRAARDIHSKLDSRNADEVVGDRLQVRIGLHAGDVISEGKSLFGDVVNAASRLQRIARPGGITMSELVYQQVVKEPGFVFRSLGTSQLKNIREPIKVYEVEGRHHSLNWRRLRLAIQPYKSTIATIAGVLVAAALIIAYLEARQPGFGTTIEIPDKLQVSETPVAGVKSIAVLPFADLSPAGDQEYFSDGLSEELLNVLAGIPGLRVVARTSSFQFKETDRDIVEIGRQLDVGHVVEGSVRMDGENLRVSVQLIKADDGFHLWSNSYDREHRDILALQKELSTAIVAALRTHLDLAIADARRHVSTTNSEAHAAFLRGRYLVAQRTESSIALAVREFETAIRLDPDYALAHAELALAHIYLKSDWDGSVPVIEAIARASPHVEQAMSLAPDLAETQYAAGHLAWNQRELNRALLHFQRAVEINPNYSIAQNTLGAFQAFVFGRYDAAFAAYEISAKLDPLAIPSHDNYIITLVLTDRLQEARIEVEKFAAINPAIAAFNRGFVSSQGSNWANGCLGALDYLLFVSEDYGGRVWLSMCFAVLDFEEDASAIASETGWPVTLRMLGKPAGAIAIAEERTTADPGSHRTRRQLALALAGAGDYARAGPLLEDIWQRSGHRVTCEGMFRDDAAAALITIRRDAGEDASDIVAAMADDALRRREAGIVRGRLFSHVDFVEGLAAYFAGERERGLALMAKGANDGYFIPPNEFYLQLLYDDPGFAVILEDQEARQIRERGKFLAVVCNDNPYAEIWQPAEGTCERFVAQAGFYR